MYLACICMYFACIFVCICMYLYVSVCTERLTIYAAKNTCRYIQYAHDMHKICQVIHTNTYNTCIFVYVSMYLVCMCMYLHVSAKIHTRYITDKSQIKQCISAHSKEVVSVSISMYPYVLYVFVCISWIFTRHSTTNHSFIHSNAPPPPAACLND